jgi:hypothetical protein
MGGADAVRRMGLVVAFLAARPFSSCFFPALILTVVSTYPLTYAAQERRSA